MLVARREVQGLADAAARAGAGEVATDLVRGDPLAPGPPPLDLPKARAAALRYLALQPAGLEADVEATPDEVRVQVTSRPVEFLFLRIIGVGSARVQATGRAGPRTGILAPE
jgi:hypothetical protein